MSEAARPRVVLVGLDGFPSRVATQELAPNLWRLAEEGGIAPDGGRCALPSTTHPGFASLLTGCLPARHGVRATSVRDGARPGWAGDLRVGVSTLFGRCADAGLRTAAIQGDHILHGVLATELAARRWPADGVPEDTVPVDAHGYPVNEAVAPHALAAVADPELDFLFVHLNEADTLGHDLGPEHPDTIDCYRATDALVGELVRAMAQDRHRTVVMVTSDHGMEARNGSSPIALLEEPAVSEVCADVLDDGGSALVKLAEGVSPDRAGAALERVPGVAGWSADGNGVLVVAADPGRVFDGPSLPAAGVHGGPGTADTVAVVGGRHPAVPRIAASIRNDPPRLVDWAPTVAAVLGVALGPFDGVDLGSLV